MASLVAYIPPKTFHNPLGLVKQQCKPYSAVTVKTFSTVILYGAQNVLIIILHRISRFYVCPENLLVISLIRFMSHHVSNQTGASTKMKQLNGPCHHSPSLPFTSTSTHHTHTSLNLCIGICILCVLLYLYVISTRHTYGS